MLNLDRYIALARTLDPTLASILTPLINEIQAQDGRIRELEDGVSKYVKIDSNEDLVFYRTSGKDIKEAGRLRRDGSFILAPALVDTASNTGFLFVPTCDGAPTGTPVGFRGLIPLVFDDTTNSIYAYVGGAWKSVVLV